MIPSEQKEKLLWLVVWKLFRSSALVSVIAYLLEPERFPTVLYTLYFQNFKVSTSMPFFTLQSSHKAVLSA